MKLGKTANEAFILFKELYCNQCLSRAKGFEYFKRFQDFRADIEGDACPSCPSILITHKNIAKMTSKILTIEQKQAHDNICTDTLNAFENDPNF